MSKIYKFSIEHRKNMSLAHKGKNKSKEHCKNISNCKKGLFKEKSARWKGGRTIDNMGYIRIRTYDRPKNKSHYVFEHRLVMEKYLGRYLKKGEVVHHINHIKTDNRIENLMLIKNQSEHVKQHIDKNIIRNCLICNRYLLHPRSSRKFCSYKCSGISKSSPIITS